MVPEFSLGGTSPGASPDPTVVASTPPSRRLRSVARYQAFHPQAMACSNTLTSSINEEEMAAASRNMATATNAHRDPGPSSLGAVAGPQGVALFRMSRPHVPLLILSHATNSYSSNRSSISSLAFQPTVNNNTSSTVNSSPRSLLYLAATRGSGVLIWDASGHSPSPLIGRLGMDNANTTNGGVFSSPSESDGRITSIAWKPSTLAPLLATTTSSSLSLWDLRMTPQGSTSAAFKPSLRFGSARRSAFSGPTAPLVQVACSSDSDECATMNASGVVRVYDMRMTERAARGAGGGLPTATFAAHDTAGVGISYFHQTNNTKQNNSTTTTTSRWLTWGLDAPSASVGVVKLWSNQPPPTSKRQPQTDPDDYWYMTGDTDPSSPRHSKSIATLGPSDYHLTAQCVRPNLACARVCDSPIEDTFLAVGHLPVDGGKQQEAGGWWAELFSLSDRDDDNGKEKQNEETISRATTFGLTKIAGFQGGAATNSADKQALMSVLGGRTDLGRLQAAELAFSGASDRPHHSQNIEDGPNNEKPEEESRNDVELLLCCLSDTGVVTTHVSGPLTFYRIVISCLTLSSSSCFP
jgi:hypothetical protein